MPLGTNHTTLTTAATFIPEVWSDEIIAEYEKSLVIKNLVRSMPMNGKKGDTVHIPKPVRGSASQKAAETEVTLIANTEGELVISIDQHYEYSRLIEDIVDGQALDSLRQFSTADAGYALAKQVDSALHAEAANFTVSRQFDASAGLAAAAGTADATFSDDCFRQAIQILDDADVPMDGRVFVIPPSLKRELLGVSNYISADFVSGKPVETGAIGTLYGVDVFVTSNIPTVNTDEKAALLFQRDALVFVEQMGVRVQTQYKQEYLSDLMTADCLYGLDTYRPESGIRLFSKI